MLGLVGAMTYWSVVGFESSLATRALTEPVAGGITTTGAVVQVQESCFRSCTYVPIVAFTSVGGRRVTFAGQGDNYEPSIGEKAVVSYRAANPRDAHDLSADSGSWKLPFGVSVLIALLDVGAIAGLAATVRWIRRASQPGN